VKSGFQWPLEIIERPENAPDDYEHDLERADGALRERVRALECVAGLHRPAAHRASGGALVESVGRKRIVEWLTYRPRPIAWAIREYEQAIGAGTRVA
jgi:hypothetical protein